MFGRQGLGSEQLKIYFGFENIDVDDSVHVVYDVTN